MLRMLARASALLLALGPISLPVSSLAPSRPAEEKVSLYCARGSAEYPDAELTLSASGPYVLNVVYVAFRPSRGRAEWTVRDCLRTAGRLDGSRPILVSLWHRERPRGSARELILQCLTPALQSLPIAEGSPSIMPACPAPSSP
jgi:hypothetical protein